MSIGTRYKVKCFYTAKVTLSFGLLRMWLLLEQDETRDANIPVLKEFYFKHIFPKIVEGAL